jgi:hypothetical protein
MTMIKRRRDDLMLHLAGSTGSQVHPLMASLSEREKY